MYIKNNLTNLLFYDIIRYHKKGDFVMKIILNKCYGGFDVSDKAYELYTEKKGISLYRYWDDCKNKKCTRVLVL